MDTCIRLMAASVKPLCVAALAASLFAASTIPLFAQKASHWRSFRMVDGLPEPACSSVTLGARGRILLRHPHQPSISHLDGYSVRQIPAPDSGSRRVHESPAGQLWTATHKGLLEFKENEWILNPVEIIASRYAASPLRPLDLPICPVRQGMVLFLLPDMLAAFHARDASRPRTEVLLMAEQAGIGPFSALTLARDGSLWLSGSNGVMHSLAPARNLRPDTSWRKHELPREFGVTRLHRIFEYEDASLSIMADLERSGRKAVVQFESGNWSLHTVGVDNALYAWIGPGSRVYAVSPNAFFESMPSTGEFVESEEISARQFLDVAVEPGGAFWLATSDGLFRHAPPAWQVPLAARNVNSPVHSLLADAQDRVWLVAGNSLHMLQGQKSRDFPLPSASLRSVSLVQNGALVLDGGGRLFEFSPASSRFRDISGTNQSWRILGSLRKGVLCLATEAGGSPELRSYDGASFSPMKLTSDVMQLGEILRVFSTQTGALWVGAERGVGLLEQGKWRIWNLGESPAPAGVSSFLEQPDGKIWCAARERIWEFDGWDWSELSRSFDRVNSMVRSRDGTVWVASNSGCQRLFQGTWVEQSAEEGIPNGAVRDLLEDLRGRIWAASSFGPVVFHPEADTDPPKASIQELRESENNLLEGSSINLAFSGQDKWKYTSNDRLMFSYRLDQRDWSEFTDQLYILFQDLPAGKHYFQVRAMDRNCNIDPRPARLEFAVFVPWYKEVRLLAIALTGMTVALFFAWLAFNRHRQLLKSYAEVEQKVAERTQQLDVANRELLQSQKMTALGTLAAGIAHDFNNILSIIKGSAQIIEQNLDNSPKIQTRVDRIKTVVEQGAGIVKAMLGFSRESGQQGRYDLNSVVEDTTKLLGDRFLHEVQVAVQLAKDLPQVVTSRDLVQQILLNFIFNAAEAMTDRKEIIIATRLLTSPPGELVLAPGTLGPYAGISVADYGCGIPPENLSRIFEPFFTTKAFSSRRGTGLGLSMVYELAKRIHAGLAVDSVVGRGSTFVLLLPVNNPTEHVL